MKKNINIISIVGARPNFMKIAPIAKSIEKHNLSGSAPYINHVIVHTGQHYDERMSKLFFDELGIPNPDVNLEVGSGSHAQQTADIMKRFEPVVIEHKPDSVLVVGDVNSTIACALVAKKLGIKVIHVEAGLRSFDMTMPEEINRILTDALSDILFITEKSAEENLLREGVAREKIHFVGNVMIDTLLKHRERARQSDILSRLDLIADNNCIPYAIATLHRPSNVDNRENLQTIIDALNQVSTIVPIIIPVHPRTRQKVADNSIKVFDEVRMIEPLGYLDFLNLMDNAKLMLTDSGGIQEETTVLGVPCLTLRENTERPVTVTEGTNQLVPLKMQFIIDAARRQLSNGPKKAMIPPLWDGKASERIISILTVSLQ